ncbi:MAG: M48 family metalloprotease [Pyrinomonadaceae bacterium]
MRHFQSVSVVTTVLLRPRILAFGIFIHLCGSSVLSNPVAIPAPTQQAVDYHNISNIVWGFNQILTLLLPAVFLIFGLGTRISNKFQRWGKYLTFVILAAIFFIINSLVQLPLERVRTATRNQLENNARVPVLQWIFDQLLGSMPLIIFSVLAALFVFWLINKSPKKWWLWTAGVFSLLFLAFLVCEPFTKNYGPLGETPTEVKISALADRVGIPRDSIVLENCEPFDKCEIAHVSGLGPTRLILLNKGLLENYPESWTIQTVAHEAKHFVKDDNLLGWGVFTFIVLAGLWLVDRICKAIIQRASNQLGFSSISQPAALPLMILALNIMFLIALPPINLFRQHVEFEADRYGLELTHENEVLAEMARSWTAKSKLRMPDPSLFFMLFRSSHPSDATRITFANEYQLKDKKE